MDFIMGRRTFFISVALSLFLSMCLSALSHSSQQGCLFCHGGLMAFAEGRMMKNIKKLGKLFGNPEGCVVCHGGNPLGQTEKVAHSGVLFDLQNSGGPERFYLNPGNTFIADFTCGQCHKEYVKSWRKSLMSTQAEIVQRSVCIWGWEKNKSRNKLKIKKFGRYGIDDMDGPEPVFGTDTYKNYMSQFALHLEMFTTGLQALASVENNKVHNWNGTHKRTGSQQDCPNCHIDADPVGQNTDGHGTGCSACHVPYVSGGTYLVPIY